MAGPGEEEEAKVQWQHNQANNVIALPAGDNAADEEAFAEGGAGPGVASANYNKFQKEEGNSNSELDQNGEEQEDEESKYEDAPEDDLIKPTADQVEKKSALIEEAQRFLELTNDLSKNYDNSSEMLYYLVSTSWLRKWKAYVSYERVIKSKQPNYKYFGVNPDALHEANKDLLDFKSAKSDFYDAQFTSKQANSAMIVLKPQLLENSHYILVSEEIFSMFEDKYQDFYAIPRRSYVLEGGNKSTEVYYQQVNLVIINHQVLKDIDGGRLREVGGKKVQLFSAETQEELKQFLVPIVTKHQNVSYMSNFNISPPVSTDRIRLWTMGDLTLETLYQSLFKGTHSFSSYDYRLKVPLVFIEREKKDITVRNLGLLTGTTLVVEVQRPNGWSFKLEGEPDEAQCEYCRSFKVLQFECKCKKVKYCSESCKEKDFDDHSETCPFAAEESEDETDECPIFSNQSIRGRCGLSNLGNTCFMNSALQCLSNTLPLTEYFLSKAYKKEINKTNVLGTQGVLARQYAKFLKNLWVNNSTVFSPVKLKKAVAKVQSMFSGYQQHDSQEFLSYILDGLHEDLNRVLVKQSTETVESHGKDDDEVAEQSWLNHMKRNQSVIVDQMQGQFKSKVTCPDCKRESITFDPFLTCSLPIPHKDLKTITAYLIFVNNSRPAVEVSYTYDPYKKLTINAFKEHCASRYSIPLQSLELFSLSYSMVKDTFENNLEMEKFRKDTKFERKSQFLIEQDGDPKAEGSTHVLVQFVHENDNTMYRSYKNTFTYARPLLVKKTDTGKSMHLALFKYLKPLIQRQKSLVDFNEDAEKLTEEELYDKYFLKAEKKPYQLLIDSGFNEYRKCPWCGQEKCKNCELPYEEGSETIETLTQKSTDYQKKLKLECSVDNSTEIGKSLSALHSLEKGIDENDDKEKEKNPKLEDCLKLFEQAEMLGEDNEWYCSVCKKHQRAQKQLQIYRAPDTLILHLKRFKGSGMYKSKLEAVVEFPLTELDMTPFVVKKESPSYYLKEGKLDFKTTLVEPNVPSQVILDQIKEQLSGKYANNVSQQPEESNSIFQSGQDNQVMVYSPAAENTQSAATPEEQKVETETTKEEEKNQVETSTTTTDSTAATDATATTAAAAAAPPLENEEKPLVESSSTSSEKLLYDLYAVTNHYGNLGFGHYTAYAKNGGKWFYYDDSSVREASTKGIVSEASYILFYSRRK